MRFNYQHFVQKIPIVICLILVSTILFLNENDISIFTSSKRPQIDYKTWQAEFSIKDIKHIFPSAVRFERKNDQSTVVYNNKNEQLGIALNSSPFSNKIFGYTGRVPLLLCVDNNHLIKGITLLENYETKEFVKSLNKRGFFNSWNGINIYNVNDIKIDAVSGVTPTSEAIIKAVVLRSMAYINKIPVYPIDFYKIFKYAIGTILILFALLSFFLSKKMMKYRIYLLLANILVFGFWLGHSLSLHRVYNWIVNGTSLNVHLNLLLLFFISLLLPLFTKKAFYCQYVCPMGCSQELAGMITKNKILIPQKISRIFKALRPFILLSMAFLFFIEIRFNLASVEPFMIFNYHVAKIYLFVLALIILILSIFIPKVWCNYLCPTGQLLDILRKSNYEHKEREK